MSTKRNYDDSEGIHASRQAQVDFPVAKPVKKQRRDGPPKIRKQIHASSVNAVRKRIRDVTRLLERKEDLPADVRIEKERALAAYNQELAQAEEEKVRQRMIKKYHMVRFFERQKATRALKKLKRRLLEATSTEEVEDIKTQMHIYEVDLNYTHYYPLNERYVSLYPPKGSKEEEEKEVGKEDAGSRPKPPMWTEIEKRMEDGTLKELRYGVRDGHVPKVAKQQPKKTEKTEKAQSALRTEMKTAGRELRESRAPRAPAPSADLPVYGMNRRERRKALSKAGAFSKVDKPSRKTAPQPQHVEEKDDGNMSDGGFFEE